MAWELQNSGMLERRKMLAMIGGAVGGAVAIAAMEMLSTRTMFPLMAIPFATSIVLVMGAPETEPAQPRALIGGHLISTLVGLLAVHVAGPGLWVAAHVAGPGLWVAALSVGLAMVAMHLTRTFHPPAGIDPLVIVINEMPWTFLIVPVGVGALMLAAFALVWHWLVDRSTSSERSWPRRWW